MNVVTFESQFTRANAYYPRASEIFGALSYRVATFHEDTKQATDAKSIVRFGHQVGVRIRNPEQARPGREAEFTIRSYQPSGVKTELDKILEGYCDWMFYGWAEGHNGISRWMVVDLEAFRYHWRTDIGLGGREQTNTDGTKFIPFHVGSFRAEPPILVASSHKIESYRSWA